MKKFFYSNNCQSFPKDLILKEKPCCNKEIINIIGPTGPTGSTGTLGINNSALYVRSGSIGNGTQESPFPSIEDALASINDNGTIFVESGYYPYDTTMNINKNNITITGKPNSVIYLLGNVVPFLVRCFDKCYLPTLFCAKRFTLFISFE